MICPLHQQALRNSDQLFLKSATQSLTYREADNLASHFQTTVQSGQRIATLLPNSPHWVCFLFACLREQATLCPLNLRLPAARIQECCNFLGSEKLLRKFPKLGTETSENRKVSPDATATILFTSGSSGSPNAVPHTLANHLASAQAANQQSPLEVGDRWLCALPLYHVGGLAIVFRCVLAGATVIFPEAGESLSQSLAKQKPTHLSLVPTQLLRILRETTPKGLKRILLGGAAIPQSLIDTSQKLGLPLAASYGMTETASQIAATPPGEPVIGSGKLLNHAQVKISDLGEILIRGTSVSVEHLHADGWLHSGDTGRLENGILFVEGRRDRQFISGGENIQPEQIETALMSIPGITQAVVIPIEDAEFGHRPKAFLDAEWKTEWELVLRKTLPGYMIPIGFEILPESVGLKPKLI
jgi:O-succinylbenzoic acid--CoA ligase